MFLRHNILPIFALVLLALAVPVTVDLARKVQDYFARAAAVPANIEVNYSMIRGPMPRPWEAMAQGGELESDNHTIVPIENTLSKMKGLGVRYIRLDHILNRPLDERMATIRAIKNAGMTPFISLSYFSTTVADKDTGPVKNWAEWERQVTDLVTRISGEMPDVYYEVWNEPDGRDFGNMSARSYLDLYRRTVAAVLKANVTNSFKVGGPALADPNNRKWMQEFLAGVADENLKIDFLSWHRYHRDPYVFLDDLNRYDEYLSLYPKFIYLPKVVSEWGTDPQPNPIHNSSYDTAHYLAVSRIFANRVALAAKFEIRDGFRNINDKNGLGVVEYNFNEKPPIMALKLLQKVTGEQVVLSGEGTNVTGLASKDGDKFFLLLTNFDQRSSYTENVPVKIVFPDGAGKWLIKKTVVGPSSPFGRGEQVELDLPNGEFSFSQPMLTNTAVLWEMNKN